ncbi:unnamed protein product [Musa hybrid cultivar]
MVLQTLILLACMAASTHQSFLASDSASNSTSSADDDVLALLSFKSLLSDPGSALSSWNNHTSHVCDWHGVRCRDGRRVTALRLVSLGLAGPISPTIANLTSLRNLHLGDNQFNGSIPPELGNLGRLANLNFSYNSLSGEIPATLSRCSRLRTIRIDDNNLEGKLPASLARCSNLSVICLSGNRLVGDIPAEYGSLSELLWLYLNGNNLTGAIPASLGSSSSSLTQIMLSNNSLTGKIPPSLGNLSSLTHLYLSSNNLVGSIPPSLGNCLNLTYLYLRTNSLEGNIPESLGSLTSLRVLDLSVNKLSGTIPPSVYNLSRLGSLNLGINQLVGTISPDIGHALPGLEYLILQGNRLEGSIPRSLVNASELYYLDLSLNNFNGVVPADLGQHHNLAVLNLEGNRFKARDATDWSFLASLSNCTELTWLFLSDNDLAGRFPASVANLSAQLEWLSLAGLQISGAIPPEIEKLRGLQQLDLNGNLLNGSIPREIGSLRNLTRLYLFGNKLSGPIPESLGNHTQLEVLNLGDNRLQGGIPRSFINFKQLNELNLSRNQLGGAIPGEVVSITSLTKVLDLSHNSLVGPIPSDIQKLRLLVLLDVSENKLSGQIPSGLGGCETLNYLYMQGNFFQSTIPSQLSNLRSLQRLDVSRNELSGQIPEFLAGISSLQYLNLSFNDFDGPVPTEGAFANASEVFVDGNPKLCGGHPALRLPPCPVDSSNKSRMRSVAIGLASLIPCFIVLSIIILMWKTASSKRSPLESSPRDQFKMVSYAELHKATDGFSSANLIGTGSFSCVYKGTLEGYEKGVAVKVLNLEQKGALKSYLAECEALRSIRHRNLVKILTCCSTIDRSGNDFKALVFEYVPNGSLDDWLHPTVGSNRETKQLSLDERLCIAIDVASALEYLHRHHGQTPIVHCDVKPSNVLIDDDMAAHLGDYGLTKFLAECNAASTGNPSYSLALRGSIGYIPPGTNILVSTFHICLRTYRYNRYGIGGEVSAHGDVYSYGILVLEMVTGKRPTDDMFRDGRSLRSFVEAAAFPDRVVEIVDPAIRSALEGNDRAANCVVSMVEVGLLCSKGTPQARLDAESVTTKLVAIRSAYLGLGYGEV